MATEMASQGEFDDTIDVDAVDTWFSEKETFIKSMLGFDPRERAKGSTFERLISR